MGATCAKNQPAAEDKQNTEETGQRQDNWLEVESGLVCPTVCQSGGIYCSEME